jgi:hypothetical protein
MDLGKLPSRVKNTASAFGALGGGMALGGTGLLYRAKKERKFVDERKKTTHDKLTGKAPLIGALLGIPLGAAFGRKGARTMLDSFSKIAKLKDNVILRDHQKELARKLDENNGSIIAAHATGTGKTLTGVSAFEHLKETGQGNRAIVVVPASLRRNFENKGVKQFTDSSVAVYGPKNERSTKNVGDKSSADYNVISYELFREHGEKIIEDTGADTLIIDEVHKVRGTEGTTYNKLRDLRSRFKNAITLTGSIVNNEPNDVVPLLDVTYGNKGHNLVSKSFFDKLFVQKDTKTKGFLSPKVTVEKNLKNKDQLAKYLKGKIDYISHDRLEKDMPRRKEQIVEVEMTPHQQKLYDFAMTDVDAITRWKIRNNLPVSQREAKDAFSKSMQARQVATDPSVLDKNLEGKDPAEYSPKIKKIVEDLSSHLKERPDNRSVIYGNLIKGQVGSVEKSLIERNIPYAKFVGMGQEGSTASQREKAIEDFNSNKVRTLLISGAGAEGLDLKDGTMMQMIEGHYNPERIQQAEARIRRLGALANRAPEEREILIKRYVSKANTPTGAKGLLNKAYKAFGAAGDQTVDGWVYSVAKRKDDLNNQFRETLEKAGSDADSDFESYNEFSEMAAEGFSPALSMYGISAGNLLGKLPASIIKRRSEANIEGAIKQKLLDKGKETLINKKHYPKILAESKIDERVIDADSGMSSLVGGLSILSLLHPKTQNMLPDSARKLGKIVGKVTPNYKFKPFANYLLGGAIIGAGATAGKEMIIDKLKTSVVTGDSSDLDIGIQRYEDKLRRKAERKYKSSKGYVNEFETKQELGIDII